MAVGFHQHRCGCSVSTLALLFYVFVYTRWLKRTTDQNIVIGGAAGAAPALVGWAAVQGSVGLPAWVLFAVVFYWTPPHFWALALRYQADYARASVPMMPVVRGIAPTTRQMLLYAGLTALASLLLVPVAGMGWIYLLAAVTLGRGVRLGNVAGSSGSRQGDAVVHLFHSLPGAAFRGSDAGRSRLRLGSKFDRTLVDSNA